MARLEMLHRHFLLDGPGPGILPSDKIFARRGTKDPERGGLRNRGFRQTNFHSCHSSPVLTEWISAEGDPFDTV